MFAGRVAFSAGKLIISRLTVRRRNHGQGFEYRLCEVTPTLILRFGCYLYDIVDELVLALSC